MPDSRHVLAIDQGTSATKAVLVAADGSVAAIGTAPVAQAFPAPGWVEQDPADIWASVQSAVAACLEAAPGAEVVAVGLSTQRESAVLWERATGKPVAPLVSWQDRRTADRARALLDAGHGDAVLAATGLPIDPMFSALKFGWLLDGFDPDRARSRAGELCLGTVDAWLLAQFAQPGAEPVVEIGNASRTQLLDLRTGQWDERLLDLFGVPAAALPRVTGSAGPFPATRGLAPLADGTAVLAVLGDSHAALFAHAGWRPGVVKATYGTGSSVMALGTPRGERHHQRAGVPAGGVCATIAWQIDDPAPALEANIRSTGRTLTWLADLFGTDVATLLAEAGTTAADGVTLVPAFGGLGAPWWDAAAAPVLSGFSLGTTRANIARAALESVAFQVADVVAATAEVGGPVTALVVDGGPSRSDVLMQLQADVSGVPVHRPAAAELSALGAASLAGLTAGLWTWTELEERGSTTSEVFRPQWPAEVRAARLAEWHAGVDRARGTAPPAQPRTQPRTEPADVPTRGSIR